MPTDVQAVAAAERTLLLINNGTRDILARMADKLIAMDDPVAREYMSIEAFRYAKARRRDFDVAVIDYAEVTTREE